MDVDRMRLQVSGERLRGHVDVYTRSHHRRAPSYKALVYRSTPPIAPSPHLGLSSKLLANHLHRGFLTHHQALPRRSRSLHCDIRHPGFNSTRRTRTIHLTIRQTLATTESALHATV